MARMARRVTQGWLVRLAPDPWADPKSRSTLGLYNLHRRSSGAQNWGIYFLDHPPGGLGRSCLARPGFAVGRSKQLTTGP